MGKAAAAKVVDQGDAVFMCQTGQILLADILGETAQPEVAV